MASNYTIVDGANATHTIAAVDSTGSGGPLVPAVNVTNTANTTYMPTMDAVARPGFQKITDGTNTMPTMDVVARKGFVAITNGTNTAGVDAANNLQVGIAATTVNNASKPTAGSPIQNLNATKVAVKASAGTLYGFIIENTQNVLGFVQLFDSLTAGVTLGTTKPDLEIEFAASGAAGATMVFVPLPACGWPFGTGLTIAATTLTGGSVGSANGVNVYPVYA